MHWSISKISLFFSTFIVARSGLATGNRIYREIHVRVWRVVHRVEDTRIVVRVIDDGRRDMRTLLTRRLLNA